MTVGPADQLTEAQGVRPRVQHAMGKLSGAQKSTVGVPAYLRFVNRRLGGWLAAVGYGLGLTPNHLTALSAGFSFLAIGALAVVHPTEFVAVAIAVSLLLGYGFDSADGQLSRLRGGGKPSGEWLDHVVDVAKTSSLHAGVAVSLFRFGDLETTRWLAVPLAFGVVNVTFFFGMMLRDQLGAKPAGGPAPTNYTGAGSVLRSFVLLPMDYGTLCLVFLTLSMPALFLGLYSALLAIMVAFTCQAFVKAYRALAA